MAEFNYDDFKAAQAAVEARKSGSKIGFLKFPEGCTAALVRFDVKTTSDICGVTLHKAPFQKKFDGLSNAFAGISCINEYGKHEDNCPFCKAVANGDDRILPAAKYGFVRMLVSYLGTDGKYSAPVPVVWEKRWAWFITNIFPKLTTYGDLSKHLFQINKTGKGLDTRYTVDYAVPTIFDPKTIPEDFSAFANFDVSKHSYWVKTAEDCEYFLANGRFPETVKTDDAIKTNGVNVAAATSPVVNTPAAPVTETPVTPAAPATEEKKPATTFGNFDWKSFN